MTSLIKRSPISAFFLSLLTPGLGQLYNGQLKKAIIFYFLILVIFIVLSFSTLFYSFFGLIISISIYIAYCLLAMIEAAIAARRQQTIIAKTYNRWYSYLTIVLITAFLIRPLFLSYIFPFKAYKIPAISMAPTIMLGDHIIVNKKYYLMEKPARGDIVVFPYSQDPSKDFIKRIIGLQGDMVEIKERQVFINGHAIDEPYVMPATKTEYTSETFHLYNSKPVTVPDSMVYVLGDNRDNSFDSRHFGFVNIADLKGKALYIYNANDENRIGTPIS